MTVVSIELKEVFLHLVRLGVGITSEAVLPDYIDWPGLQALAEQQGLLGVALDGIDKIPQDKRPRKLDFLQWIGMTLQYETQYDVQQKAASEMALLFHHNAIRTYVLKGAVVAECYPNPIHRNSVDLDCFLTKMNDIANANDNGWDAWSLGNDLIKTQGFEVSYDYYKNSTFLLPGLTVENHQYLVPFRGNKTLKKLEKFLQNQLKNDSLKRIDSPEVNSRKFDGAWLYRPPVMVTAIFLIEHAYSHFLHEGLTWRLILDWMMFSRKHKNELDWNSLDALIDEFGFRKFYDSFFRLGQYLTGEFKEFNCLNVQDKRMLEDVWAELDLHETLTGIKGKLALVGNTWRARWKYHYFAEISWIQALWIQVRGFLFEKKPKLD